MQLPTTAGTTILLVIFLSYVCFDMTPTAVHGFGMMTSVPSKSSTPSKTSRFYKNDDSNAPQQQQQTDYSLLSLEDISASLLLSSRSSRRSLESSLPSSSESLPADAIQTPSSSGTDEVKSIDLPKHSPPSNVVERTKLMLDMEITIGRIAMISFLVVFVLGELSTGMTAQQQILMINAAM